MLAVPILVLYVYLAGLAKEDTVHEERLIRRISNLEINLQHSRLIFSSD